MQEKKYKNPDEFKRLIMMDIQNKIHEIYIQSGIKYNAKENPDTTVLDFFSLLNRLIPVRKRKVHLSDSLKNSLHLPTLKKYEEFFNNGEDMNPYLSKKAMQIKQLDYLQLNWHLYHLHFNSTMSKKRSSLLLLCIINQDDAFFVDVINHPSGNTPDDFLKFDYLKTIYRNGWMKEIGFGGLKGFKLQNPITDSKEIFKYYTSGINILFEFEGECFSQMDFISLSRHRHTAVNQLMLINQNIEKLALYALRYIGFDFSCDNEGRLYWIVTYLAYDNSIQRVNLSN